MACFPRPTMNRTGRKIGLFFKGKAGRFLFLLKLKIIFKYLLTVVEYRSRMMT